ncbi:MAG TPA: TetR/AcrR family transcriptional regulator [Acidimicrobiales bacterium]
MSTDVNKKSPSTTTGRVARGAATRATLITVSRDLFGSRGFADTSLDDVVAAARVTKGALYHHFRGKEDLFAAVYEQVLRDVSDRVVAEFLLPDPWQALLTGSELWIDAHLDPAVQRIVMRDARAVLSWDTIRTMEARFGAVPLRGVLRRAIRTGSIGRQPLRPLALMIMGALNEACFYVASAEDTEAARDEVRSLTLQLLSGLGVGDDEAGE